MDEDFELLEELAEALNLPMMWRDKIEDQLEAKSKPLNLYGNNKN